MTREKVNSEPQPSIISGANTAGLKILARMKAELHMKNLNQRENRDKVKQIGDNQGIPESK